MTNREAMPNGDQIPFDFTQKKKPTKPEAHYEVAQDCSLCGNEFDSIGKCRACEGRPEKEKYSH